MPSTTCSNRLTARGWQTLCSVLKIGWNKPICVGKIWLTSRRLQPAYEASSGKVYVERIPVRQQDEVILLPVRDIASIEADGEVLNITTVRKETHSINYRLKDLEARLDPSQFVRLSRGSLARLELITRVTAMPGGTCVVTLKNDQRLPVSRIQSRILREQLLRL